MSKYLADINKYDPDADVEVVKKIGKHLGWAMRDKDSSLVACDDPAERDRVRENWLFAKLGMTDAKKADALIAEVCQMMNAVRMKNRVTFYYLVAKKAGLLNKI